MPERTDLTMKCVYGGVRRREEKRREEMWTDLEIKGAEWYVRIYWKERGEGVEEREGTGERCLEDERGHELREEYRVGSGRVDV